MPFKYLTPDGGTVIAIVSEDIVQWCRHGHAYHRANELTTIKCSKPVQKVKNKRKSLYGPASKTMVLYMIGMVHGA